MATKKIKKIYGDEKYSYYPVLYLLVLVIGLALLLFKGLPENEIFMARRSTDCHIQTSVERRDIDAPDAPAGVKTEYTFTPEITPDSGSSLIFYQVHHWVEVYVGDELVYSLSNSKSQTVLNVGSSWVEVPLHASDADKLVRVVMTPLYSSVAGRAPVFYVGSVNEIFKAQLIHDMPDIAASFLTLVVGVIFILLSVVLVITFDRANSLLYLGCFSAFIGVWKITDARSATLMMSVSPAVLSALSIAMLPLAASSFLFYTQMEIGKRRYKLLNVACAASIIITVGELILHATGIRALRETLVASHVLIVLAVLAGGSTVIIEWLKDKKNKKAFFTSVCFALCILAVLGDIVSYYVYGSSNYVSSMLIVFLVYVITMGLASSTELRREASLDNFTELYNRSSCNELIHSEADVEAGTCFMMFDLNGLKSTNDSMGHEYGDRLIKSFSRLLRQNMPEHAFLGRYGGDEFIAVVKKCGESEIQKILSAFSAAVDSYNASKPMVDISYSVGYAISDGHHGCTMQTLLSEADNKMYLEKKRYYEAHDRRRRD